MSQTTGTPSQKKINLPCRLAVLASQSGTTFESVVIATREGVLNAEVVLLLTNNPKARVIEKSQTLGVQSQCLNPTEFSSFFEWDEAVCASLKSVQPDLILLAGFLRRLGPATLAAFPGRIINTHPSLLPKYGGQGMYGRKVHEAVIAAQEKQTGVSVHLVSEVYDEGRVIRQKNVPVHADDTAETLEERVKDIEKQFLLEVLKEIVSGSLRLD